MKYQRPYKPRRLDHFIKIHPKPTHHDLLDPETVEERGWKRKAVKVVLCGRNVP